MFDVLLTLCLAGDPAACTTERHPGGETRAACRAEADRLRLAAAVGQVPQSWPCVPEGETPRFTVTEVAPGVFVHKGRHAEAAPDNRGDLANLGFVIGDRSVAVIDAGGSAGVARDLLAAIRERTDLPVSHLVLTHMHPDHTLGASVLARAGAAVIGHPRLEAALAARREHYLTGNATLLGDAFEGTEPPPEVVPAPGEIDLGGRRLVLRPHATAHTDNDLTALDTATGTLFAGDLVFLGHLPALDGSLLGWLSALEAMRARDAERLVPGHGPVAVDWPEGAAPTTAYLERLASDVRAAIAAGTSMLRAVETAAPPDDRWLLTGSFHPRNVTAAYSELEWE